MEDEQSSERRKPRSFTHASRFVLSVDGQRKISFQDQALAMAEGRRIAAAYPRLNVSVHDQQEGTHASLSTPIPERS